MFIMNRMIRYLVLGPVYFYHRILILKSKKWDKMKIENFHKNKSKDSVSSKIIGKNEIMKNPGKYVNRSILLPLRTVYTGGTTGTPFKFFQDYFITRQKERAYLFDMWSYIGYKPFDYSIVIRGNMPEKDYRFDYLSNSLIISQTFITNSNRDKIISIFHEKPFYLQVYPSVLFYLIDLCGKDLFSQFLIKGIMAGSEAFPVSQMKWFKSKFDIPISHWYGHSEYAILARFCNSCGEFHFYPTYGKMQLDSLGNKNRIIATGYNKYGTQFKNYFTGDYGIESKVKCSIDYYDKLRGIEGRSQEYLFTADEIKTPFGPLLFGIHNTFWDQFVKIQFIQNVKGEIQVFYIPSDEHNFIDFSRILEKRFNNFRLNYSKVNHIETTKSGKHKYLIQKIIFN